MAVDSYIQGLKDAQDTLVGAFVKIDRDKMMKALLQKIQETGKK